MKARLIWSPDHRVRIDQGTAARCAPLRQIVRQFLPPDRSERSAFSSERVQARFSLSPLANNA